MTAATFSTLPVPPPPPAHAPGGPETVRRAAEEFEAVFLTQMLSGLFQGLGDAGGAEAAGGGGAFEGLLHEEYAKLISRSGGIGLADNIRREMLRLQEVAA